jgi:hypothetical protein
MGHNAGAADVKVPPLMLQPLLENAVYHGIEPSGEPGTVRIGFARTGDELHVCVWPILRQGWVRPPREATWRWTTSASA